MWILIPSLGRSHSHTTGKLLDAQGFNNYCYVLDNADEADDYIKNGLSSKKIIIAPEYCVLPEKRLFLTKYASDMGWDQYLSLDDDIVSIKGPGICEIEQVRNDPVENCKLLNQNASVQDIIAYVREREAPLLGFAIGENLLWRQREVSRFCKISAQSMVIRPEKSTLYRDKRFSNVEEDDFVLQVLAESGNVERLNFYRFKGLHFSAGGLTVKEGAEIRRRQHKCEIDIPALVDKYGVEFIKPKKGVTNIADEIRLNIRYSNLPHFRERYFSIGKKSVVAV